MIRVTPRLPESLLSEEAVQQQQEAFATLLEDLRQTSPAEIRQALGDREEITLESGLDADLVTRVRQRIAGAST